jgi:hypothetical protein
VSAAAVPAGAAPSGSAPRLVAAAPVRSLVPVLARQEARRLLRHPLTLLGFSVYTVATASTLVVDQGPRSAFETVSMVLTFYPGVLLILAGNLVATRDRRADAVEMLGPLPGRPEERVKALALAALAPATIGLVLTLALHAILLGLDRYAHVPEGIPGAWHIMGGPVTLGGAVLFGQMLGVWSPARTTALLGTVAIVVATVAVESKPDLHLLSLALGWARWGVFPDSWAGLFPGSPAWHVVYLLGLCGMAFATSWVRVAARRSVPVVVGLSSLAIAVAAGLLQMP